jgi:tetratricopeptide (TPR) repeat protein
LWHGDFAQATQVLEQGLALCPATENRLALPLVAASLGPTYLWSGRATEAVPLLEEAVEAITAMRFLGLRSWVIPLLAEAHLVLGRISEAHKQAEQAMELARAHRQQGREAWGLKLLGDVHAHEPAESEQAVDTYRRAFALATELGMRPVVAHCHFGLGKLYEKTNKREQAREHLTTAITMYREMDMQFWLEQAQTALGPSHGNPP